MTRSSRLAWFVWGLTFAGIVGYAVFGLLAHRASISEVLLQGIPAMAFATVGLLIVTRTGGNAIGWVLMWFAVSGAVGAAAGAYAAYGLDVSPVPGALAAAWLARVAFVAEFVPLPLLFLLFPDGRVPSPKWRPVLWLVVVAGLIALLGWTATPGPLSGGFAEFNHRPDNPLALPASWGGVVDAITQVAGLMFVVGFLLSILSLVMRFRRSTGDERQQIRWVAYASALFLAFALASILVGTVAPIFGADPENFWLTNMLFFGALFSLLFAIPIACALAILRYRLYDLDLVIKKAALALVLTLMIGIPAIATLAVASQVLLYRGTGKLVTLAGGVLLGIFILPLIRVARRVADRLVYGRRASSYEVLTSFSGRMGETYATDDVLPRMAQILSEGLGADSARVWLLVDRTLRPAASWPSDVATPAPIPMDRAELPSIPGENAVPVRHQGDILGALSVSMPASDPMTPARERLVADLADQAGLVLQNVRLIEELKASRQRLVGAQDEERRRLERNIHDGAQQQLVALSVKLNLAQGLVDRDPHKAHELLEQLQIETHTALEDLRDLARGIYPPLLADKGLAAALKGQARKSSVPVTVEAEGVGRAPQEVEAAVYFSVLEALQNVTKYAGASQARVELTNGAGSITFRVTDDGRGFDPSSTDRGTGLQGIADRLAALGGDVEVRSRPGSGTTVEGRIPMISN